MNVLKDVPEFVEKNVGESIVSRTETLASFKELGPPDLVHLTRGGTLGSGRESGTYHFVSGVDGSSSASLAAYINSLTNNVQDNGSWWGGSTGKGASGRITRGAYCTYNAFSRVDVRVEVRIPGGVEAYIVDPKGMRHEASSEIWHEVYLSGVLRSILYADDKAYQLAGYRRLDPIGNRDAELKFLSIAESLFARGWQLGSDPDIQVATNVNNLLISALTKYFSNTGRWNTAANLYEKLSFKDNEVNALLAEAYLGMNDEAKAVALLNKALEKESRSYALLHVQVDFLRDRGRYEWALPLAKRAVHSAPSEFVTWAKLTQVNIELGRYADALLTLNSCPMFTYSERDLHRIPPPVRAEYPAKDWIVNSGFGSDIPVLGNNNAKDSGANTRSDGPPATTDASLLRLPAPSLRGTFAKAYSLLTLLVKDAGWDQLLKLRSQVFVMEDEYRMHKMQAEQQQQQQQHADQTSIDDTSDATIPSRTSSAADSGVDQSLDHNHTLNKTASTPTDTKWTFSSKRLCERWLDNLFMVLYEDLRVFTIWQAEVAHFKSQNLVYKRTPDELEILGDLADRLHHPDIARHTFETVVDLRFASPVWSKLLDFYTASDNLRKALYAAVTLATHQHRWYDEMTFPTHVSSSVFELIRRHGLNKVSYTLVSFNLPVAILRNIMQPYFNVAREFALEGSDQ